MIHIHNGDVVNDLAKKSGIPGEHMAFREALVAGPAPGDLETRARFLAQSSGENLLRVRNGLIAQERALDEALASDEVVLWFEHDLFCFVNLLYLLERFARCTRLSLVWCPEPLSQQELDTLFESRAAVTPAMLALAHDAWLAYTSPDPRALNRLLGGNGERDFPFLRDAIALHASRFPSTRDGLGSVERRLLELIAGGASDFITLFSNFDEVPPRFGFGDSEVMRVLRVLATRPVPLVTITEEQPAPPKALLALTPAAENVLRGEVDYVSVNDPDYWLGGVHLTRDNVWRWDEGRREIVPNRSAG
jgi:hypothetical protein